jgi:hypothetical protein
VDKEDHSRLQSARFVLSELARIVFRRKWFVIVVAALCAAAAAIASVFVPKTYEAITLIAPVTLLPGDSRAAGLGQVLSQVDDLVGMSIGGNSKMAEVVAALQSEVLTEAYIRDNNLLPVLFGSRWDAVKHDWKRGASGSPPTLWEANRYFDTQVRHIATYPRSGLVSLTISWPDARQAATWANGLVRMANDYLRDKAIAESQRNIAYLHDQAARTTELGPRQAIYSVLQEQINKAMLARGTEAYAFRIVDPAAIPERAAQPRPEIWGVAGLVGGVMLSILIAVSRESASRSRAAADPEVGPKHGARYGVNA